MGKLIVTTLGLLISEFLLVALACALGEFVFGNGDLQYMFLFLKAYLYTLPMILSAFFLFFALKILAVSEVFSTLVIIVLYNLMGNILGLIGFVFEPVNHLRPFAPSVIVAEIQGNYQNLVGQYNPLTFVVGIVITIISLGVSYYLFTRRDF